jgi:hypothetical protein
MTRNAETELLDDIQDIFSKYDITKSLGIAQEVVDLVKSRLLSPDDMGALDDRISEMGALCVEMEAIVFAAHNILPESVR